MNEKLNHCDSCGEDVDSNLEWCHECDRSICVDNCVASTNEEHGLSFCYECMEKLNNMARRDALRAILAHFDGTVNIEYEDHVHIREGHFYVDHYRTLVAMLAEFEEEKDDQDS